MTIAPTISHEENHAALGRALDALRGRLERFGSEPGDVADEVVAAPALDALSAHFELTSFERAILLLCAAVELDAAFAPLCARIHGDAAAAYPTFSLALAALDAPHWSALLPDGALRRWRLVEVAAGPSLTRARIRIDERVLHAIVGLDASEPRLVGIVERAIDAQPAVASQHAHADAIVAALRAADPGRLPLVALTGGDRLARRVVASLAAESIGLALYAVRAEWLPTAAPELEEVARLLEREAAIGGWMMLVERDDAGDAARRAATERLVEALAGVVVFAGDTSAATLTRAVVTVELMRPSATEQQELWRASLPAELVDGWLPELVAQYDFGPRSIRTIAAEVSAMRGDMANGVAVTGSVRNGAVARNAVESLAAFRSRLWSACRAHTRGRIDELAQRIEPRATWDDLVLAPSELATLRQIAAQVRGRATVYGQWGFARKLSRGLGISALFAGVSGTGKTMAAEVLAGELGLDLYRIDLSQVVSKYIGETEKNLRRVFDAAEEGGAILLFDEADALFGKRSEVKDSHDRYANIEVSYLLQRMEAYRGLAILTSNIRSALDTAFLRRLRFVVEFPFPDAAQREEIWRRVIPAGTPTEGLDPAQLARLMVPGGNIINIALNGAFLAAEAGEPVRMAHLLRAARSEYAKLEKTLTGSEIGGWK